MERLIQADGSGRMHLGTVEGQPLPSLEGIELGRTGMRALRHALSDAAAWWDAEREGVNLAHADLAGANLRRAGLEGANLTGANLAGALLSGANLREALLEHADLTQADLANARLAGAVLGAAKLGGAMLEDADLRGASMRFADLAGALLEGADLRGADLWGANLSNARCEGADFTGATLTEANLAGAHLSAAVLRDASLGQADLSGARLDRADLSGANLRGVSLRGAVLTEARLRDADLSQCDLTHVHLAGAWLLKARIRLEQLGGAIGEELAGQYDAARLGYLVLERNFEDLGDYAAARWAYCRKRVMGKRAALRRAREAAGARSWRAAVAGCRDFAMDQLVEWVCGYGESVARVVGTLLFVYLLFSALYLATGSIVEVNDTVAPPVRTTTHRPIDALIFSLLALTTSGSPAVALQPSGKAVHLLTGLQALLGIGLTGLLGFVVGNRIRR
ncbi:MAG: pentapeptide repeat-containing protein [Acetobacteraceae bacterium]|nr:pentapeptide repeat-containing protein [Acetobacteraceae bacterium]